MTLIVMGISGQESPSIIATCDRLLSSDLTSYEGGFSKIQVGDDQGRWLVGFSGDPDRFELFRAHFRHHLEGQVPDIAEVRIALSKAYASLRQSAIEHEILVPAQIEGLSEFKERGTQLGSLYDEISREIRKFDVGISIIAAGFGSKLVGLYSVRKSRQGEESFCWFMWCPRNRFRVLSRAVPSGRNLPSDRYEGRRNL